MKNEARSTARRTKSVLIKMPAEIKTPLVAEAVERGASFNDIAVGILAQRLRFDFSPSQRSPSSMPDPSAEDVILRLPTRGKLKIQDAALRANLNMTDYVNQQLAAHLGVRWEPSGRVRVPFGGGRRQR